MSKLVQLSEISRRDALRGIALAVAAAGFGVPIDRAAAQEVHGQATNMKGALGGYQRQELTEHEWATVTRLAELIVPADEVSGSAVDAGAVEFIDLHGSAITKPGIKGTSGPAWSSSVGCARWPSTPSTPAPSGCTI